MKRSLLAILLGVVAAAPLMAQGRGHGKGHAKKEYEVEPDRAMSVTRAVLVHQGYEVVRVETVGDDQVVYYRRGNRGRGRGKGRPMKMIIRREEHRVVFVDAPEAVLVDINVRLRL